MTELSDREWVENAKAKAHAVVMSAEFPWTNREKRLWYIGMLAGLFTRKALEAATVEQLIEWHKDVTHS